MISPQRPNSVITPAQAAKYQVNWSALAPEEQAAVQQFAEATGPDWASKLVECFATGEYGPSIGSFGTILLNRVAKKAKLRTIRKPRK